jgi:hypothetical protein
MSPIPLISRFNHCKKLRQEALNFFTSARVTAPCGGAVKVKK